MCRLRDSLNEKTAAIPVKCLKKGTSRCIGAFLAYSAFVARSRRTKPGPLVIPRNPGIAPQSFMANDGELDSVDQPASIRVIADDSLLKSLRENN
jgi:hypothetical protein